MVPNATLESSEVWRVCIVYDAFILHSTVLVRLSLTYESQTPFVGFCTDTVELCSKLFHTVNSSHRAMGLYAAKCMTDCVDELGSAGSFDLFVHATQFFGHQVIFALCFIGVCWPAAWDPILIMPSFLQYSFPLQNIGPLTLFTTQLW